MRVPIPQVISVESIFLRILKNLIEDIIPDFFTVFVGVGLNKAIVTLPVRFGKISIEESRIVDDS